ncbi:MAG TPA: GNAT family N-acetyltransferase [Dongiaceae bacterium]
MDFVLRPARSGDGASLFEVTRQSVMGLARGYYTQEQIDKWMAARDAAYYEKLITKGAVTVAERDGGVVGFVDAVQGEVTRLFIRPDAAGQGLGSALLEKGLIVARQGHAGPIKVEATINAERFYERHGFQALRRGYFSHGVGGPPIEIVHMELPH